MTTITKTHALRVLRRVYGPDFAESVAARLPERFDLDNAADAELLFRLGLTTERLVEALGGEWRGAAPSACWCSRPVGPTMGERGVAVTDSGTDLDEAAAVFMSVRPRLFGIAYRMLSSATEAEDLVQDVWLRWQRSDRAAVVNPAAFLATTTTRLAINALQSGPGAPRDVHRPVAARAGRHERGPVPGGRARGGAGVRGPAADGEAQTRRAGRVRAPGGLRLVSLCT